MVPLGFRSALRVSASILALLLGLLAAACSAPSGPRLAEAPAGVVELPVTRVRDFFLVECTVGDSEPLHLLLDTGSAWLVLGHDVAPAGVSPAAPFEAGPVAAGTVVVDGLGAQIRSMKPFTRALGVRVDGILGYPFFRELLLEMDYPQGRVTVSADAPGLAGGLPVDALEVRPFVPVLLGESERRVLLDTGSGVSLAVADVSGLSWRSPPRAIGASAMIDGLRVRRTGRLDGSVVLDGLRVPQPLVESCEEPARVGTGLLRHAVVRCDQRTGRVSVDVPGAAPAPPPADVGTAMAAVRRDDGFEVLAVFEGPAAASGLSPGDLIVAIDGQPVDADTESPSLQRELSEGPLLLLVERDGERRTVTLVPEVLVR